MGFEIFVFVHVILWSLCDKLIHVREHQIGARSCGNVQKNVKDLLKAEDKTAAKYF